jgi:hypothetical protein
MTVKKYRVTIETIINASSITDATHLYGWTSDGKVIKVEEVKEDWQT